MKAVLLQKFGEPVDVLECRESEVPTPAAGEVRVRMLASPVNPSDLMMIRGVYGKLPALPITPGFEGVGIVEQAGPGLLGRLLVGKRVAFLSGDAGSWRQFNTVVARQAVPLPASIPTAQAAMFFVNPATAWVMTRDVLAVPRGECLLQTAAASALGQMVVRLGKQYGFRTLNVVRRPEHVEVLKRLGGDVILATSPEELQQQVMQQTQGRGVRWAIDPVGGATGSAVVRCLAPGGRLLVYGTLSSDPLVFSPRDLMTPGASIEGFWLARWLPRQRLWKKLRLVRTLGRLLASGVLSAEVHASFPLEEIRSAVEAAETKGRQGKVLLRIHDG